jgi:Protein of unknown function DUF262/Protein of unknown function (DUF1524)
MIIKPSDKTMKALLDGAFFKIPRFQRPYSWDQENVDDFWSDAIASNEADYFIGSFVLYREAGTTDVFMVVDGQQRLTTTTILLAAIRNAFDSIGEGPLAKGTQSLIERVDVNSETRFVLLTETSYPYLQEHIQKHGSAQLAKDAGAEEEAIETAFKYLTKQVDGVLLSVEVDSTIPAKKKSEHKRSRLLQLRDSVLRLQLIAVELQSEDDAYLIFETLNTRGKDLGIADLVKNLVTRLMKPSNKGVDIARDKWRKILDRFDESVVGIDVNAFIYHSWISRSSYVGKEKLFREIKNHASAAHVGSYLDDLVSDSILYRQILEPSSGKWSKQEADVLASLRALALFRVGQPLPMILAILREYRAATLSLSKTREVLRSMENFHVQFTALTAQRTGGGTAKMYAAAAQELTKAKSPQQRANAIKTFKDKLKARVPTYAEFEASFAQLEYLSTNTRQKPLVQYRLQRIDEHLRTGPPVDYNKMTIEHVASEKPAGGAKAVEGVGSMGNLILLDGPTNNSMGNKPFAEKKVIYMNALVAFDPDLKNATSWDAGWIAARTKSLADLSYKKVFSL